MALSSVVADSWRWHLKSRWKRLRDSVWCPGLDAGFYRRHYPDLAGMSKAEARRHWRRHGKGEGRLPTARHLLAALLAEHGPLPEDFSVATYRRLNPDLRHLRHDAELVAHWFTQGCADQRPYRMFDPDFYGELHPQLAGQERSALLAHHRRHRGPGNIVEALLVLGIGDASWLTAFDLDDYRCLHPECARPGLTRWQAIRHFLEVVAPRGGQYAFDARLDLGFYTAFHPDLADLREPMAIWRHWLSLGRPTGRFPTAAAFFASHGLPWQAVPEGWSWQDYAALNREAALTDQWSALRHLLDTGVREGRPLASDPQQAAALWTSLGTAQAARKLPQDAIRCYQRSLALRPGHPSTLTHLANAQLTLDAHREALATYDQAIAAGADGFWPLLNRAKCRHALADLEGAVADALAATLSDPSQGHAQALLDTYAAAWFQKTTDTARALILAGRTGEGQQLAGAAAERLFAIRTASRPLPTGPWCPGPGGVRRIVMLADDALPQCVRYRIRQKAAACRALGLGFHWFPVREAEAFLAALNQADAVIFYRVPALPAVVAAIHAARQARALVFYEIDDLIFDSALYPDPYASYGGQISQAQYAGLQWGVPLFRAAMAMCPYGIASTPTLVEAVGAVVGRRLCFLHRNAWDEDGEPPPGLATGSRDGGVTIFYGSGSRAHWANFEEVAGGPIRRLLDRHPRVRLLVAGYMNLGPAWTPYRERLERVDFQADTAVYLRLLARADINIAPLTPGRFNDGKSELKWFEAARLGIPSVLSRTATYAEVVEDGVDACLASTAEGWELALERLITDPGLRQAMGERARAACAVRYGLQAQGASLHRLLEAAQRDVRPDVTAQVAPKSRILVANVFYPPQAIGGATRVVADTVAGLRRRHGDRYDLSVICCDHEGPVHQMRDDQWDGVRVTRIGVPRRERMDWFDRDPQVEALVRQRLLHERPDLVHAHCIQRLTASLIDAVRAEDIPYLIHIHDAWWTSDHQFLVDQRGRLHLPGSPARLSPESQARLLRLRESLRGAARLITVSDAFARVLADSGVPDVLTIRNGVDPAFVRPRVPARDGRLRLGHIGGIARHKGFHLIRQALLDHPFRNLHLTVVDLARDHGYERHDRWGTTPVRVIGRVPPDRIGELYAELDVVCALSIWPESFGLVAREAVLAGCRVLASDRGAMGDDLLPGQGWRVQVDDLRGILDILQLLDQSEQVASCPAPGTPDVATVTLVIDALDKLYTDTLARPKHAP